MTTLRNFSQDHASPVFIAGIDAPHIKVENYHASERREAGTANIRKRAQSLGA